MIKKITKNILYILAVITSFALVSAYLSMFVHPEQCVIPAFFATGFFLFLGINIVFTIIFIVRKKWFFLLPFMAILIGAMHFDDFVALNTEKTIQKRSTFSVMSYNVRMFNFFKWKANNVIHSNIFRMIEAEHPDILCLQEFYSCEKETFSSVDSICSSGSYPYFVISHKKLKNDKEKLFGLAIFSKYPIVSSKIIVLNNTQRKIIVTRIRIGNDTLRILNFHAASVHLDKNDYNYLENFSDTPDENFIEGARDIVFKMVRAYKKRADEADEISEIIANSTNKTIVCGDFNDTPLSYSYHKVRGDLHDAFADSGFGFGNSYAGFAPFFRIDCILHHKHLKSGNFRTIKKKLSDHYPVMCEFTVD